MSLYHEAAPLLVSKPGSEGSLKSKIFGSKDLKSQPKQIYALVSEAAKWSPILVDIIEKSRLLQLERKLSPNLALLLVHDLLLAKKGISAPASHPLRIIVERHKARLSAELTKARLRRGFASIDDLRILVDAGKLLHEGKKDKNGADEGNWGQSAFDNWPHPRWIRINTIKTDLGEQMRNTFCDYKSVDSIEELLKPPLNSDVNVIYVDKHIPNLVALSPAVNLAKTSAYRSGLIILQDKASCFPAYLLNPEPQKGQVLDACAAPGNKTTHLAAILREKDETNKLQIYACERDKARAVTLGKMVQTAGASGFVSVRAGQDFLRLDPDQAPWNDIGHLLLDPSCSGSGMVTRDELLTVMLPSVLCTEPSTSHPRKRKRKLVSPQSPDLQEIQEEVPISNDKGPNQLSDRLSALSTFQLKLLVHAFRFPKARRVAYSTCSIYAEENEHVVVKALSSEIAMNRGWRILPRGQQVSGMRDWQLRGDHQACTAVADTSAATEEVAEACIRCEKGTQEGTQGFFVVAFVRDEVGGTEAQPADEQWEGFSDQEHTTGK